MAHFAEIDTNNTVLRVLVVPTAQEHRGQEYLADDLSLGGTWVQTSYTKRSRLRFAGIGSTYDPARDIFIDVQPFPSWVLNEETTEWEPPVPCPPNDAAKFIWDEVEQDWHCYATWNDQTGMWEEVDGDRTWSPFPRDENGDPLDGKDYQWDEDTTSWVEVTV
jgi:hypothetical protein